MRFLEIPNGRRNFRSRSQAGPRPSMVRAQRGDIAGNHSNLYVINARDGSCLESFYIGHLENTIDVPPVPLLGRLLVIENAGTDYANVHVLRADESGQKLRKAQSPFPTDRQRDGSLRLSMAVV